MCTKRKEIENKERGFGLVSVLLGLVIVVLLSLGVYSYFSSGSAAAKAYSEAQFSNALAGGIKSLYTNGNYTGLTTQVVIDAGIPAKNRIDVTGKIINSSMGGTITVAPGTIVNTDDSLVLTYSQVPEASCMGFLKNVSGMFEGISITTAGGGGGTAVVLKTPGTKFSVATAAQNCAAGTASAISLSKL